MIALLGQVNGPLLEELATIVSPVLGWSPRDSAAEVDRTSQILEKVHGVMADALSKSPLR
jgi:glycerol-3-phosphate dehydrogenase